MYLMDASGSKCQLSLLCFWHSVSKNSKSSSGQFFRWFVHVTFIIYFGYLFFSSTSWSWWHSHIRPKWLYSACHSSFENIRKMNGRGEARYDKKLFFCLIVWLIYRFVVLFLWNNIFDGMIKNSMIGKVSIKIRCQSEVCCLDEIHIQLHG